MAIYSVGRKRVIIALLLTTVLLLTLDLRGNPVVDAVREGFTVAMRPVEAATGVVTNPIERAWHGLVDYDDLEQENIALQEQVGRLIGSQAGAVAAVIEGKELQALYSLPSLSGIDTEVARVVGYSANNLDQVIEIDKGSSSGIEVGMPVVNQAGLVGKVTRVLTNSARVMLVTDARYAVAVKVTSSDQVIDDVPTATTPSGLDPDEIVAAATTTTTTVPGSSLPVATYPNGLPVPQTTLPVPVLTMCEPQTGPPAGQVLPIACTACADWCWIPTPGSALKSLFPGSVAVPTSTCPVESMLTPAPCALAKVLPRTSAEPWISRRTAPDQ